MIKILINRKNITWGDLEAIESGALDTYRQQREFLAKFVANGDGKAMEHAAALDALKELNVEEMLGVFKQVREAVKALTENAVPLESELP